jgi:cytidylate kinase
MNSQNVVIAIDGPAGAGKSTVSKLLAKMLNIRYLDTGAMYRCLAFKAIEAGLTVNDGDEASELLKGLEIQFGTGDPQPVFLNGVEVTAEIRSPQVGEYASALSQFSPIRKQMVDRQKKMVADGGVVLEGRDVTTVVAPDATLKVYLTASLEERAKRRLNEFVDAGAATSFLTVRDQILQRDHRDITRDDSPLTVAEGAEVIESAGMSPLQVAETIVSLLATR